MKKITEPVLCEYSEATHKEITEVIIYLSYLQKVFKIDLEDAVDKIVDNSEIDIDDLVQALQKKILPMHSVGLETHPHKVMVNIKDTEIKHWDMFFGVTLMIEVLKQRIKAAGEVQSGNTRVH